MKMSLILIVILTVIQGGTHMTQKLCRLWGRYLERSQTALLPYWGLAGQKVPTYFSSVPKLPMLRAIRLMQKGNRKQFRTLCLWSLMHVFFLLLLLF